MSKFNVGQRVKKVREQIITGHYISPVRVPIGEVGTVVGHSKNLANVVWVIFDVTKCPDVSPTGIWPDGAYSILESSLVPIYDGDQPAAFDAHIWQPKHDTVRA